MSTPWDTVEWPLSLHRSWWWPVFKLLQCVHEEKCQIVLLNKPSVYTWSRIFCSLLMEEEKSEWNGEIFAQSLLAYKRRSETRVKKRQLFLHFILLICSLVFLTFCSFLTFNSSFQLWVIYILFFFFIFKFVYIYIESLRNKWNTFKWTIFLYKKKRKSRTECFMVRKLQYFWSVILK